MRVIDVLERNKRVERRVDGGRARIQIEGAMVVHRDHIIFGLALGAAIFVAGVTFLEGEKLLLVKRREILLG